jgi:hypothetical protein
LEVETSDDLGHGKRKLATNMPGDAPNHTTVNCMFREFPIEIPHDRHGYAAASPECLVKLAAKLPERKRSAVRAKAEHGTDALKQKRSYDEKPLKGKPMNVAQVLATATQARLYPRNG